MSDFLSSGGLIKGKEVEVRYYILILSAVVLCTGCAQMKYSGRYQEVRIESEPSGAKVLVEGKIDTLKPAAVKAEDGTMLAYHSPMQLTTPVVVILDKECGEYTLRMACEGFPEYEKALIPRFAFHPYLIITFPVVPLWSNYEIQRFDDVFVDFAAYKTELEELKLGKSKEELEEAKTLLEQKTASLEEAAAAISEKEENLGDIRVKISELTAMHDELQEAISETGKSDEEEPGEEGELEEEGEEIEEKPEVKVLEAELDEVKGKLEEAQKEMEELEIELDKLRSEYASQEKEKNVARERLEILQTRYDELRRDTEKDFHENEGSSGEKSSEQ